jgi:hypothetical protein
LTWEPLKVSHALIRVAINYSRIAFVTKNLPPLKLRAK